MPIVRTRMTTCCCLLSQVFGSYSRGCKNHELAVSLGLLFALYPALKRLCCGNTSKPIKSPMPAMGVLRREHMAWLYAAMLYLLLGGIFYRQYYAEVFTTFSQAYYFVLITCTTIGYGDMSPASQSTDLTNFDVFAFMARPSPIPSPCTRFTRAGIEWRRCHRAVCMARPYKEPHHSGQAEP